VSPTKSCLNLFYSPHTCHMTRPSRSASFEHPNNTGWSKSLCPPDDYSRKNSVYLKNPHTVEELKRAITEYILNVDHAILNTVFENTVRRVNKCLETGGGHFEH
jgi:hypothetical protein